MARRPKNPLPPRECVPDLPDSLDEVAHLSARDDLLAVRIVNLDGDVDAAHSRLTECVIDAPAVGRFDLTGATLSDVAVTDVRASSLTARDGRWRTVLINGGRIGTLDMSRAELDAVELRNVRVDYLSLASATAVDVRLTGCVFGTIDLPEARIERLTFEGCRADEVDTRALTASHTDLRGLEALSFTDPAGLRGATLSERQVEQHAASFAAALGILLRNG